jgi:hypothetical protein
MPDNQANTLVMTIQIKAKAITRRIIFISLVMGFPRSSARYRNTLHPNRQATRQPINGSSCAEAATLCTACLFFDVSTITQAAQLASQWEPNSPYWLAIFLYSLPYEKKSTVSTMSRPNVITCPRCGAHAHRTRPNWWQRLWLGRLSQYFCAACKHRFNR